MSGQRIYSEGSLRRALQVHLTNSRIQEFRHDGNASRPWVVSGRTFPPLVMNDRECYAFCCGLAAGSGAR